MKRLKVKSVRERASLALVLLAFALGAFNYFRPVPDVRAKAAIPTTTTIAGAAPALPWPSRGSAAVGVSDVGLIAAWRGDDPIPMASVAKVMTALVVLGDRPFENGQLGPTITITDQDVQVYESAKAQKQSVVEVRAGEQLPEFQALEALLIPSGNNIAVTLARWDAGSIEAFVTRMNQRARDLGMTHTNFADPAGVSTQSVSTASDLLTLGMAAMRNSIIAVIVGTGQAKLPVAGTVYNVNYALGQSGIVGIKTGSGLDQGANFLFSASWQIDGYGVTLLGVVLGQPTLDAAFDAAKRLIAALQAGLRKGRVVSKNETVGRYEPEWGGDADVVATSDLDLVAWPGMILRRTLVAPELVVDKPLDTGLSAGSLHIVLGDFKSDLAVVTAGALYPPTKLWRLFRIG